MAHSTDSRASGFWPLAVVFALFVLFMYGPMFVIFVLSFQGPEGGLTFPMRGTSLHWFRQLAEGLGTVDIGAAFTRSLMLGAVVMAFTVVLSVLAGLAFRKKLSGGNALFYVTVASLIMPSIIVSLGIGLQFRLLDGALKWLLEAVGATSTLEDYGNVIEAFAQTRQTYFDGVDPVQQILTKTPGRHGLRQRFIGGANQPDIDRHGLVCAQRRDLAILQRCQQFHLLFQR